jgi:uncharacterized protein YehS (DUF1456 family)
MHPYLENLLFETSVPIVLVTTHDLYLFKEDPIEYLRKYQDTSVETRQTTRLCMIDFLQGLVSFKAQKYDPAPVFLHKFLEFCMQNLNQYSV